MLERSQIIEIVVSVTTVALMIGVMAWIGTTYGGDEALSQEGGQMLVGAIVGFIVLMTIVGIGLAFALNDPEDGLESEGEDVESENAA